MSLINKKVSEFKVQAYQNGEFKEVTLGLDIDSVINNISALVKTLVNEEEIQNIVRSIRKEHVFCTYTIQICHSLL